VNQLTRWKGWYTGIGSTICPKCPTSTFSDTVFPVSLGKKTLKKQKLRLLSFHEENTGDIQTQATKILRLANG